MAFAVPIFAIIASFHLPAASGLRQDSRASLKTSAAHSQSKSDRGDSSACPFATAKQDYYFDLQGGGKKNDRIALHLQRKGGKPVLTIHRHQVWNIKTFAPKNEQGKSQGNGELVFTAISPRKSPPKRDSKYHLFEEAEYIRQYFAKNDQGEKVACIEIQFNSTNKLEFAGGTYYPEEKVTNAFQALRKSKADDGPTLKKATNENSLTPALVAGGKNAAGYAVASQLAYLPASVFFVEYAAPLSLFMGGPVALAGLVGTAAVGSAVGFAKAQRRSKEAKFGAAEQLFEQLWCLSSRTRCHFLGGSDCFYRCPPDIKGRRMIVPWKKAKKNNFKCKGLTDN